jgi:hypothetical protein
LSGTHNVVATLGSGGALSIYVDGVLQTTATDTTYTPSGQTYIGAEAVANPIIQPPQSLQSIMDYIVDGVYGKVNATALTNGNVDVSKSGVINKNLTNVADGSARFAVTNAAGMAGVSSVDSNNRALIDFSQSGHLYKNFTNIADGSARFAVTNAAGMAGVSSVDSNNRALIDFSQTGHLNKTLAYIPDDPTTGRVAQLSYFWGASTSSAQWVLLGTWTFANYGEALRIEYLGGQGFNTNNAQQSRSEILVRAGDNAGTPNISGATWYTAGGSQCITGLAVVAVGGSTSPSNNAWEIYALMSAYTNGIFNVSISPQSSFSWSGANNQVDPGGPSSTVVVGTGAWTLDQTGRVATIHGAMAPQGSVASGASSVVFSYASTDASLTPAWTSGTLYRMDGTTTAVASGSQAVTGLSASTTYYSAAYYDETSGAVSFVTGASGAVGTPAICYTSQTAAVAAVASQQANLNFGWLSMTTAASGGTGGGGTGGACCVAGRQRVRMGDGSWKFAEDIEAGDTLPCPGGVTTVRAPGVVPWRDWRRVAFENGIELIVAEGHRFVDPAGAQRYAVDLRVNDVIQTDCGYTRVVAIVLDEHLAQRVSVEVNAPHLYYLNGILCHNKYICPV